MTAPTGPNDKATFEKWIGEQMQGMVATAFPQLSKFMSFSDTGKADTKNAGDKAKSASDDLRTPNGKRSRWRQRSWRDGPRLIGRN
jgi:hypothetical protein